MDHMKEPQAAMDREGTISARTQNLQHLPRSAPICRTPCFPSIAKATLASTSIFVVSSSAGSPPRMRRVRRCRLPRPLTARPPRSSWARVTTALDAGAEPGVSGDEVGVGGITSETAQSSKSKKLDVRDAREGGVPVGRRRLMHGSSGLSARPWQSGGRHLRRTVAASVVTMVLTLTQWPQRGQCASSNQRSNGGRGTATNPSTRAARATGGMVEAEPATLPRSTCRSRSALLAQTRSPHRSRAECGRVVAIVAHSGCVWGCGARG